MANALQYIKKIRFPIIFIVFILSSYLLLKFALPSFALSKLSQVVLKETGFKLNIQKVFFEPIGFSVDLKGVSFSNKHSIKNISVDFSIMNILKKRIVISELVISGIEVKLLKDQNEYSLENLKKSKTLKNAPKQEQTEWGIVIKKFNINQSRFRFNDGPVFKIDKLTISDIFSFNSSDRTSLSAKLSLNDSFVEINGHIKNYLSSISGEFNILSKKFDLKNANYFLSDKLGMIEGVLGTNANVSFGNNGQKATAELTLRDFKLYSKDLKTIDYFIHDFNLINGRTEINKKEVIFNAKEVNFENLILSIRKSKFSAKNSLSRTSKIQLKDFHFSKPHVLDSKSKPMTLSARYNNGGVIRVKEYYKNKEKKLDAKFLNINLLPFSETFESILGYQVETGKLDLNIDLVTINHNIKGKAKLVLSQFGIDDEDESGKDIKSETILPLKTAISLIRNDKGAIELEFDISGDERNPEFGFLPLIRNGLGSFLLSKLSSIIATKAATQFLPLLVSSIPFSPGNALLLVNGSYKFLTKPRFQDIEFFPNSDKLKDESNDTIDNLKKFLLKNEKFSFVLCPLASIIESEKKDNVVMQDEDNTLKLALSRIEKVKLVLFDTPEIVPQIMFCRPKIVKKKTAVGILEISL